MESIPREIIATEIARYLGKRDVIILNHVLYKTGFKCIDVCDIFPCSLEYIEVWKNHIDPTIACKMVASYGDYEMYKWASKNFPCNYSECLEEAIIANNYDIVKDIVETVDLRSKSTFADLAIHFYSCWDILTLLMEKKFTFGPYTYERAALRGQLDVLNWLYDHNVPTSEFIITEAALGKQHDVILWCWRMQCEFNYTAWIRAVDNNDLETLNLLYTLGYDTSTLRDWIGNNRRLNNWADSLLI